MLEGGVNQSLGLDGHGKALSFFLLGMEIEVDAALLAEHDRRAEHAGRGDDSIKMAQWENNR